MPRESIPSKLNNFNKTAVNIAGADIVRTDEIKKVTQK